MSTAVAPRYTCSCGYVAMSVPALGGHSVHCQGAWQLNGRGQKLPDPPAKITAAGVIPDRCPRCQSPLVLDLEHLRLAHGSCDDPQYIPILLTCYPNGHTVKIEPPERRGHFFPICDVCGEPVVRTISTPGARRRFHEGACEQKARRNPQKYVGRPERQVFVPDERPAA